MNRDEFSSTIRRLRANKYIIIGGVVFCILLFIAAMADFLAPQNPLKLNPPEKLLPPSASHLLGTDDLGRDILSRVIYGSRISLLVGIISICVGLAIGVPVGLIAGYYGKWTDIIIQRFVDAIFAFPDILLALTVIVILGKGIANVMIAVGVVYAPYISRMMRGNVLAEREKIYVLAERALGASDMRIIFRHIMPNSIAPVVIQSTLLLAFAMIVEASLSFLGLGTPPPTPSWGRMISDGRGFLEVAPWFSLAPGFALTVTVLGINFLGIGLSDYLNPRLKGA